MFVDHAGGKGVEDAAECEHEALHVQSTEDEWKCIVTIAFLACQGIDRTSNMIAKNARHHIASETR